MSTNTSLFPDVNVLLALAHARHQHYQVASLWIDRVPSTSAVYFCRISQLGLLRLLTTQSAMGGDVMTLLDAWTTYDRFFEDGRFRYLDEPPGLESALRKRTSEPEASPKLWADAYLASFSALAGLHLVTFDQALAKQTSGAVLLNPKGARST